MLIIFVLLLIINRVLNVLSTGHNKYTNIDRILNKSTHAEVDAINNLKNTRIKKKINIYVLRVNRTGNLCYSKPCDNCVSYMNKILIKRNYKINKIYYTQSDVNILSMKL